MYIPYTALTGKTESRHCVNDGLNAASKSTKKIRKNQTGNGIAT